MVVEAAAKAMWECAQRSTTWEDGDENLRTVYLVNADRVLDAVDNLIRRDERNRVVDFIFTIAQRPDLGHGDLSTMLKVLGKRLNELPIDDGGE